MSLRLDTSRAIRTLAHQRELIQAIVDAHVSEQETDWLEWKTDVDLGTKDWQATTSRHVLGFSNRHPDAAASWCEGSAYIVFGAAPGVLQGTKVYDVAKLNSWLSAYVGNAPDAPQWSATYVDMGKARVLLVTVEKPRWGDPIWTLQKQYTPSKSPPMRAGTIYVRRQGSTEQAGPGEVRMLSQRAGSGPRRLSLSIHVSDGDMAVPIDTSEELFKAWAATERGALTPPSEPKPDPSQSLRRSDTQISVGELHLAVQAAAKLAISETRTVEKFNAEVDAYLAGAAKAMPTTLKRGAIRHRLGRIRLWLDNETEHNFSEVVVELSFDQPGVPAYFDRYEVEGPDFPTRPAAWGSHTLDRVFDRSLFNTSLRVPAIPPMNLPHTPRGRIDNSGSSRIRFAPVNVRPLHSHRLETIYLVVDQEYTGQVLEGTWVATAADTSGLARGGIIVPVADEVPAYGQLLSTPSFKEDDADD